MVFTRADNNLPGLVLEPQMTATRTRTLYDYKTGTVIGPATRAQVKASLEAAKIDGGSGVIFVDGRAVYAQSM